MQTFSRKVAEDCTFGVGDHVKVIDPDVASLPVWCEVVAFDAKVLIVTYRVLTNDEMVQHKLNPVD